MKIMMFAVMVLFSFSAFASDLVLCKRISDDDSDNGDRFRVEVISTNPLQKHCPLMIKTRDKIFSDCDDCYLNLWKVNDVGRFPCRYFGKDIELKCKKDK